MKRRSLSLWLVLLAILIGAIWYGTTLIAMVKPSIVRAVPALQKKQTLDDNQFSYPAIGVSAPITVNQGISPLKQTDWGAIRPALTKGLSLSFDAATFNKANFAFLIGHSSDTYPHPYSSVFAPLGQAKIGDQFLLNVENKNYTFKITDTKIIVPTDISAFEHLASDDPAIQRVALVTCWPVFTTRNRLVVIGDRKF